MSISRKLELVLMILGAVLGSPTAHAEPEAAFRAWLVVPSVAVGEKGTLSANVEVRGRLHLNARFPTAFSFDEPGPGIELNPLLIKRMQINGRSGQLRGSFRASRSGPYQLTGTLRFSACDEAHCEVHQVRLAADAVVR